MSNLCDNCKQVIGYRSSVHHPIHQPKAAGDGAQPKGWRLFKEIVKFITMPWVRMFAMTTSLVIFLAIPVTWILMWPWMFISYILFGNVFVRWREDRNNWSIDHRGFRVYHMAPFLVRCDDIPIVYKWLTGW